MSATKKTPRAKKAMPRKRKTAVTTSSSPTLKLRRMTKSTVTTVSEDGPRMAWSTVLLEDNEPRPLTMADIPAIVNAVLEVLQPSATNEDISPDHASAVPPRTIRRSLTVILLHAPPYEDTTDFGNWIVYIVCIINIAIYFL